jgi:hypothetical protein
MAIAVGATRQHRHQLRIGTPLNLGNRGCDLRELRRGKQRIGTRAARKPTE